MTDAERQLILASRLQATLAVGAHLAPLAVAEVKLGMTDGEYNEMLDTFSNIACDLADAYVEKFLDRADAEDANEDEE